MKILQRITTGFALVLCSAAAFQAKAQDTYPNKPIRMIVPFAPGGVADLVGRVVAEQFQTKLNAKVVVENKAGGTGLIGTKEVLTADPDGYTLLIGTLATMIATPASNPNAGFDPQKDVTPLSIPASYPLFLLVNPSTPVNTPTELVALAKSKNQGLTFGSAGPSALNALTAEFFARENGIKLVNVPFRGGPAASTALIQKEIDMLFEGVPAVKGLLEGKTLKPLAITSKSRLKDYPEVPTMIESGFPSMNIDGWVGLFGPKGMPDTVRKKIDQVLADMAKDPAVAAKFTAIGFEAFPEQARDTARYYNDEVVRWQGVLKNIPTEQAR